MKEVESLEKFREVSTMKQLFLLFLVPLCLGLMGMESCFPGDGTDVDDSGNDALGTPDHGPPLSYTDNGDGTFTDNVTKWTWEIKTDDDSVHDLDNTYAWTAPMGMGAANGTLFTVFLDTLNNKCDGDETITCNSDADCGVNGPCGFAGYRDWCIPNAKRLHSIIDYSVNPASRVPGLTAGFPHWSSTTAAFNASVALNVEFFDGRVLNEVKTNPLRARAVRPCD